MAKAPSNRRIAREVALHFRYQYDITGCEERNWLFKRIKFKCDRKFANRLIDSLVDNSNEIDQVLQDSSAHWKIERMDNVDRNILRTAICEILYFDDVPFQVSINEAVEIAKVYCDTGASIFINGVLDAIANKRSSGSRA